jgi:hypothetical protein
MLPDRIVTVAVVTVVIFGAPPGASGQSLSE